MKKLNYTQFVSAMLEVTAVKLDKFDMQVAYTFYNSGMSIKDIAPLFENNNSEYSL